MRSDFTAGIPHSSRDDLAPSFGLQMERQGGESILVRMLYGIGAVSWNGKDGSSFTRFFCGSSADQRENRVDGVSTRTATLRLCEITKPTGWWADTTSFRGCLPFVPRSGEDDEKVTEGYRGYVVRSRRVLVKPPNG